MALRNNSGAPEREGTMEQKVPAGGRQSVIPQLAAVQTSCGTARGAGGRRVTEEKTQASSGDVLVPQASSGDVPVLPASSGDVQVLPASSGDVLVSQALSGDVPVSPASSGDVPPSPASSGDLPVSPALSGYVPVSPVLSGHVPVSPASSGDVPLSPALSGDVLIPPTSSGDVPLSPALSENVPIPPASSGDVPLSPASSGDVPLSSASSGDVPLSPVLSGNVPIPPASSGNVPIPPALSGDVLIPPASSGDVPLPKASSGNVPIPPASFGDEQDEDYCQESDFDSDSTPSSCDYPMLSPPAQRKKTCQGMVTTRQQSLVFSMAGWHPVALAPQAMMLPAQSVSRLTFPNNVQLPTDLTVLQQQLRTTASSGDVPLPPASSGDVPLPPASSGDDRMKTTVTIRRVILILMAHLFQATCTTTQCCHHLQKGRKHAKKYQTNTMYCHLPQTDCHLPQMSCHLPQMDCHLPQTDCQTFLPRNRNDLAYIVANFKVCSSDTYKENILMK